MKKQTAVDWLVEQYQQTFGVSITKVMIDKINQAKEMEKEQIEDFFCMGILDSGEDGFNHYYEGTFKSE